MKRKKIKFQKLLNGNSYPLAIRLNVFQWMIETGWEFQESYYTRGEHPTVGVFEKLWRSSCINMQHYNSDEGFHTYDGLEDQLSLSFVGAIVDSGVLQCVKDWREKERITLNGARMLWMDDERWISYRNLRKMFDFTGKTLNVQFNPLHENAKVISGIMLTPNNQGWQVIVKYGFPENALHGSSWSHDLLPERTRSVAAAVLDATAELERMTQ